jgi:acetoin utilization protein AcuB
MRAHHIRHLPVLRGGELEGLISERDIALVCALPLDPEEVTVEEAMSPAPYAVSPDTPIADVVQRMADQKLGSAIIVEGGEVVGIVTTTDCLGLLWRRLSRDDAPLNLAPSMVRHRIAAEHNELRGAMDRLAALASQVCSGDRSMVEELRAGARGLYERLQRHIALEDEILAPALRDTPGFGEIRAERLIARHAEQREELAAHLGALDDMLGPALAARITEFIKSVRADVAEEEEELLNPTLLKDDPIQVEFAG